MTADEPERETLTEAEFREALQTGQRNFSDTTIETDPISGTLELDGVNFPCLFLCNAKVKGSLDVSNVDMGTCGTLDFSGLNVEGEISLHNISGLESLDLSRLTTIDGLALCNVKLAETGIVCVDDPAVALTCMAYFGRGVVIAPELAARFSRLLTLLEKH